MAGKRAYGREACVWLGSVRMAGKRAYGWEACVWLGSVRMAGNSAYGWEACVWLGSVRMAGYYCQKLIIDHNIVCLFCNSKYDNVPSLIICNIPYVLRLLINTILIMTRTGRE